MAKKREFASDAEVSRFILRKKFPEQEKHEWLQFTIYPTAEDIEQVKVLAKLKDTNVNAMFLRLVCEALDNEEYQKAIQTYKQLLGNWLLPLGLRLSELAPGVVELKIYLSLIQHWRDYSWLNFHLRLSNASSLQKGLVVHVKAADTVSGFCLLISLLWFYRILTRLAYLLILWL